MEAFNPHSRSDGSSSSGTDNADLPKYKPRCIILSHGLGPINGGPNPIKFDPFDHTLSILPVTRCTSHANTSFLPLERVARLTKYTCRTRVIPVVDVSHFYCDCVLEFPYPPPISSNEERRLNRRELDGYMQRCYQCDVEIDYPKALYMFRDYVFCCETCRYEAGASYYWFNKAMNIADEVEEEEVTVRSENDHMDKCAREGRPIFFIGD